jgi:hypothetical protein
MKKTALLLVVLLSPLGVFAQRGIPPFGSFSSTSFDTINNQNLNVYFTIPIVSSAGRGLPLTLSLNNNSQLWQPLSTWTPVSGFTRQPNVGMAKGLSGRRLHSI